MTAITLTGPDGARSHDMPAFMCGISESFDSLTESIKQVEQFFNSLTRFFGTIQAFLSITGLATVVLFIVVILFSTGLSALGVRRGKFSFILSLAAADAFWLAWEKALGTDPAVYLPSMIRSNAILLVPLALVFCITYSAPLIRNGWTRLLRVIHKVKKGEFSPDTAMDLLMELDSKTGALRESILLDLKRGAKKDSFPLSDESLQARQSLEKTLKKI